MVCLIEMIFGFTANASCAIFGQKLKAFLCGSSSSEEDETAQKAKFNGQTFSQNPNYVKGPKRKYKRMTKATLEDQSQLSDRSGSLWVMEGQGAYLFSQNIVRMIGDPLAVRIEGEPKEQLESKAKVISDLLDLIESRRQAATRRLAEAKEKPAQEAGGKEKGAKAAPAPGATEPKTNNKSDFSV